MKEDILQRLTAVLNALDNTFVRGKTNLANLSGSIAIIEEVCRMLDGATVTPDEASKKDG